MRFLVIFIFVISAAIANETPYIKNVVINNELKKYDEITFLDGNKKIVKLSDYKGNLVLLNFWASWCAPCKEEMPSLDELKSVTADKILNTYQKEFPEHYHSPAVDGYLIKRPTWLDIQNKDLSNMRVIIGTNADEYYANTPENVTPETLEIIANQLFPSMTDVVMNAVKSESDPRNIIDRLYTA